MACRIRTAVAAIASDAVRRDAVYALSCAGIELLGMARSGDEAIRLLRHLRPDLLAADAELPAIDGHAIAQRIREGFCLPVRPAVALLCHREFLIPENDLPAGAVRIDKPVRPDAFIRASDALACSCTLFSPAQLQKADALLDALGVPGHIGRDCLKHAALLCAADERNLRSLGTRVYPLLAQMYNLNAAQAERAVRHVIERAWQSDQFENQYRIFADTVDAGRGQPTPSEMIFRLADILRLEG